MPMWAPRRRISWRNHKGRSGWSSSPPGGAGTGFKLAEAMSPPGKEALRAIPPWREQLTARGLAASLIVGATYSLVAMKLSLTTGLVPSLNVSSSFLAFVLLRAWTGLLRRAGLSPRPFTPQENAVVQTCAAACYSVAMGGRSPIPSRVSLSPSPFPFPSPSLRSVIFKRTGRFFFFFSSENQVDLDRICLG